jgi:hypothetical protein
MVKSLEPIQIRRKLVMLDMAHPFAGYLKLALLVLEPSATRWMRTLPTFGGSLSIG